MVFKYPWQTASVVDAYADTDHAGCIRTRKSTSGGCLMIGQHLIKSWSGTQPTIMLSSREAEMYGVVKVMATGLGYLPLLADLGIHPTLRVWTDSIASKGICSRQGLGKVRHLDVQQLWIQQRVRRGEVGLHKVPGDDNPADMFTKADIPCARIDHLSAAMGCEHREGRASSAPALRRSGKPAVLLVSGPAWPLRQEDNTRVNREQNKTWREDRASPCPRLATALASVPPGPKPSSLQTGELPDAPCLVPNPGVEEDRERTQKKGKQAAWRAGSERGDA